ncbi:unnamed protein product [Cylindrotheca closterium]|uniref:PDZ domain-containing protein n=1 Tax=Cylindrotheca closterium TaxID=2856 RepID=A0AAD2JLK2_9STRA|nr:unnamed protein product [Cylindrotheca closterium]
METEFSPYGTLSEFSWPSAVTSLEVERATSDASAITLPIGSRRQTLDDRSLKTVDMAGRILNYWRPKNEEGSETLSPFPNVVHEPPEKQDHDSVSSAETEPFDVINERKKKEAEDAAKSPIKKLTEYLVDKKSPDGGLNMRTHYPALNLDALPSRKYKADPYDNGIDATLNIDALPSHSKTLEVANQSDDTTSEFSAFNFAEISSAGPGSPNSSYSGSKSDPGTPDSEFQRKLNHRRRLQRIRVLAALQDDGSDASFHSTGTPTKLRERRDRKQRDEQRKKSFGFEDPLMKTREPLVGLPEEEVVRDTTPGLSLAEDEYSLFSFEQANETQSPEVIVPTAPSHGAIKPGPSLCPSVGPSVTSVQTPTIHEDRELHNLPENMNRIKYEKIVGDEAVFSSASTRHENDTASVRMDYGKKTYASEVQGAIKDVLFLGNEAENRPGRKKKSDRRKKKGKAYLKSQKSPTRKGAHRSLPGKEVEARKGDICQDLAFTFRFSPSSDEDDNGTKNTEETRSMVTKSPVSFRDPLELATYNSSTPPERQEFGNNHKSAAYINQLQRRQQGAPNPDIFEGFPFPVSSLNSDQDFVLLALFAAQAVHELQGVRFDDSYPLDMYEDLKISVVELKLPLGLILMENAGGCFVNKIAADGSATRSGGVEVGDQLAAINGQKCLKIRVEDIYKIVLTAPEAAALQFAFIRYIGPFRPETQIIEDDNSVIDNSRPRQTMRVVKDVSQKQTADGKKLRKWFRKLKGKNAK